MAHQPRYLECIIFLLIIPVTILNVPVWARLRKKAFFLASVTITLIGWAWSYTLSSHGWWMFGDRFMSGINVVHHLSLEEGLFHPFGGMLTLLLYVNASCLLPRFSHPKAPALYWTFLIVGTLVFMGIAWATRQHRPYYLHSMLATYNFLCCLLLAPFVAGEMNLFPLSVPILVLGTVGYLWDFFAIKYGWWAYLAITQIRLHGVTIEEFNYYCFAPVSAVSIYLAFCRFLSDHQPLTPQTA